MVESLRTVNASLGLRAEQKSGRAADTQAGAGEALGRPGQAGGPVILPVLMEQAFGSQGDPGPDRIEPKAAGGYQPLDQKSGGDSADAGAGPVVMAPDLPTDTFFGNQYHLRNTAGGQRDLALFRGDTGVWAIIYHVKPFAAVGTHIQSSLEANLPRLAGLTRE